MNSCKQYINDGIYIRYILTFSVLYLLSVYHNKTNNRFIRNYLYLLLPFLLLILDLTDNIVTTFHNQTKVCAKTFHYQKLDKICDLVSYFALFLFFDFDNYLKYFVLYRGIGVILFCLTKNSIWLIVFFDFIKEYLLYLFIFGNKFIYLPFFMVCKIIFEYYLHTKVNKSHY